MSFTCPQIDNYLKPIPHPLLVAPKQSIIVRAQYSEPNRHTANAEQLFQPYGIVVQPWCANFPIYWDETDGTGD